MAYSFGGGVRPELGRTDFTPFLQGSVRGAEMQAKGAENMAAGVSQFLTKAGEGVKAYQENKAINTMFNSTVDDAIKINEEGGGELARMLKIADPSDRGAWSAAVKSLGEGDKKKGSMAVRTFMMQMAQQEKQRAEIAAALASRPSAAEDAIMAGLPFEQVPTGAGAFMPRPPTAEERFTSLAPIVGVGAAADAGGFFLKKDEAERQAAASAIPQTPDEAFRAAGLTPETGKVSFQNGRYVAVPFSKEELQRIEKNDRDAIAAIEQGDIEQAKLIKAGEAARNEIQSTIALLDQSIALAKAGGAGGGAGGPIAGSLPVRRLGALATGLPMGVGSLFRAAGSDYAVRQKSLYDTIRARLTFDKIGQLKALSESGSTGLGAISNLEFNALGDSAGQLLVNLPEDQQLAYLETIKNNLTRLLGSNDQSTGISEEAENALKSLGL